MIGTQAGRTIEANPPTPSWYKLFFGCFGSDAGSKRWIRRGLWGAVVAAAVGIAATTLKGVIPEMFRDVAFSLSITTGVGFIHWTMWKYIQDLDELHQRIMLESYVFSFLVTMTLVAGIGMFNLAARTAFDILWVYVTAEVFRGIGLVLAGRRYR
jgi:hypothetical protein